MEYLNKEKISLSQEDVSMSYSSNNLSTCSGISNSVQISINPNRIVNKEFIRIERFICTICSNLLIDMKKCSLCGAHFCSDCINKFKKESDYCPKCNIIEYKLEEGESYL